MEMVREGGVLIKCDISDSIWRSVGGVGMVNFVRKICWVVMGLLGCG